MACCQCDDHDYCCQCSLSEPDRALQIVEDILDGTYRGKVDIVSERVTLSFGAAKAQAEAIVAVLQHEGIF